MSDELMTALEAVNTVLRAVGEAPVSTLSGTLPVDVAVAQACIDATRRRVLMLGWQLNSEDDVPLSLNQDGEAVIPPNTMKIELSARDTLGTVDIVQRGSRLYDRKNHTYVFTTAPRVNIVYLLSWDELTEQARCYIALKAARINQQGTIGSTELSNFTAADEMEAFVAFQDADVSSAKYNVFNNPDCARFYQYRRG